MSRWESEHGTITVPDDACDPLRRAVIDLAIQDTTVTYRKFRPGVEVFTQDGLEVTLALANRTVVWSVEQGNWASELAHQTPLGRVFLAALRQVRFTPDTGGVVRADDETNGPTHGWAVGPVGLAAVGPTGMLWP